MIDKKITITPPGQIICKQVEIWRFVDKLHFFHYQLQEFNKRYIFRLHDDYKRTKHWDYKTKQTFIDALIRQTPTPNIVVRELQEHNTWQILDGYERITAIQEFLLGNLCFPSSFKSIPQFAQYIHATEIDVLCDSYNIILHNKPQNYKHLSEFHQSYCKHLIVNVSVIKKIHDTQNQQHETIARTIFQQLHPENN